MSADIKTSDSQYEWRTVTLLALGFGLVGLDRWIITPLFPTIMQDLKLSYQDVGMAVGALAVTWGLAAIWMGRLADQIGRRKVIIPALVLFSVISGFTGIATGVVSLVLIRALIGAAEGAYTPACIAATSEASLASRRGRNQGIVFCMFPLFGLGLGPILATQLLAVTPSWSWVFYIAALPGFIVAYLLYRTLREPATLKRETTPTIPWSEVLKERNVKLASLGMICAMACVFVLGAMMPSYLQDYLHLSVTQMGFVMSALGFGGCAGNFLVPTVSDYVGRKPAVVGSAILAASSLFLFTKLPADPLTLFITLLVIATFAFGIVSTMSGPVATESVVASVASSAIGVIVGVAEVFGGGVAPILAGFVADHFGLQYVLYIGLVGLCLAVPIGLMLKETAPRIIGRSAAVLA